MLQELFEAIGAQAVKAEAARIVTEAGLPPHKMAIRRSTGEIEIEDRPPAPRSNRPASIETLFGLVMEEKGESAEIWYSRRRVVGVMDSDTRWDVATFTIEMAPQILALLQIEKSPPLLSQKSLVLALRTTFDGCLPGFPDFIRIVRELRFETKAEGHGVIEHGKTSLGKSVRSELYGTSSIPEYVTFEVPVFLNVPGQPRQSVRCAIEIHPESQNLQIIPLPGQIEGAIREAEELLGGHIRSGVGEIPIAVYYGEP